MEAGRRDADREELEQIGVLIENAHALPEVEALQERLLAWVSRYPEEKERLADFFEQLFMMHESAQEAQSEADTMHLSPEEIQRREEIFALRRRVRAEDPPAVFSPVLCAARQSLQEWEATHPEDPQLPYLRKVLETEESVALSLHEIA
jgi:DNA-binding transcriptional regulator YiaG